MSSYTILRGEEARKNILGGAEELYNAVSVTMGPRGRNVIIERPYNVPVSTHDGVTVAKYVSPNNPKYRASVAIIREAAETLNRLSGDGTTTVTVLCYTILSEANKLIEQGANPMRLWREIEACVPDLLRKIDELKEKVETEERLAEVATISCADPELGAMIAKLVWAVGADGTVTVEDGMGLTIESNIVEGYTFERGWISPLFITDTSKNEARLKHAHVYLTDQPLTTAEQAYKVVAALPEDQRSVLIVADDVKKEALAYLSNLKTQGSVEVVAVKAPGFGDARTELLKDIGVLTHAEVITKLRPFSGTADFGKVGSVTVSRDTTTLVEGAGNHEVVAHRLKDIRAQAEATTVELEKKLLNDRASALSGKVAQIKVGGLTDAEVGEKKDRVDDAVAASMAALKDGIVAGGGVTPYNLALAMAEDTDGERIIATALVAPIYKLLENAGMKEELVMELNNDGEGYDVTNDSGEIIDMKQAGIIDPAQVTKQAIETAVTVAISLMTGGVLMVIDPEKGMSQDELY